MESTQDHIVSQWQNQNWNLDLYFLKTYALSSSLDHAVPAPTPLSTSEVITDGKGNGENFTTGEQTNILNYLQP